MAVGDESDVTFTLKATLEQYSFSLDVLNNPEKALMNSKLGYYDLPLLDVNMLRMGALNYTNI